MLECNKGIVKIKGGFAEVWADWQTLTVMLYKDTVKGGATQEDTNKLMTAMLFNSIEVADRLLKEEGR